MVAAVFATIVLGPSAMRAQAPAAPAPAAPGGSGRIAGRIVDAETGLPLAGAQVAIIGTMGGAEADLDGRYRTGPLAVGTYAIRARRIGFAPSAIDSVRVTAGQATIANFALRAAATQLATTRIVADAPTPPSSEAGLLALQQRAAAVSDGVSAEQIARAPDSDAGDAVKRITGVSIVDDKFVVIRGLSERYSNTLLNGVELASPEPLKKLVPLDVFPASLIESLVATKTATPDKPGDFAGGSVEIRTKEFPENFVFQLNVSRTMNSQATFQRFPLAPRGGTDFLARDDGGRAVPAGAPVGGAQATEQYAEAVRNVWTPASRRGVPGLGLGMNLGGQRQLGANPLGYIFALTYGSKQEFVPTRFWQYAPAAGVQPDRGFIFRESRAVVDVGGTFNLAYRLGSNSKFGWKNLYTRNAEDAVTSSSGFTSTNSGAPTRYYGMRYAERAFLQTQLTGDHLLMRLLQSRVEWKATFSAASWDEPDNRAATYGGQFGSEQYNAQAARIEFRSLDDRLASGLLDWTVPMSLRRDADASLKFGGLYRVRSRNFDAAQLRYRFVGGESGIASLPPEQLFSPENVGDAIILESLVERAQPYTVNDTLLAYYAMVDAPIFERLRFVGGLRMEQWRLSLDVPVAGEVGRNTRNVADPLWSGNMTFRVTDAMNVRAAVSRTVSRPDARELSPDCYSPVAGEWIYCGNVALQPARITNSDLRWERYARPGEIVAISVFHKQFDAPIIETVFIAAGSGNVQVGFNNALTAINYGLELEGRRRLDMLPGVLRALTLGANVTLVQSRVTFDSALGSFDRDTKLQGQSPLIVNASLSWADTTRGINASVLYNSFSDRIQRYGVASGAGIEQGPNLHERGRAVIDAKVSMRVWRGATITASGRNLGNTPVVAYQQTNSGRVETGRWVAGVVASLGIGYDF